MPNAFDRVKVFFKGMKRKLWGKDGAFSSMTETKNTLRKIAIAWLIGNTKKVGGWLMAGIGFLIQFIPYIGIFGKILMKWGPLIYSFIANQLTQLWSNAKAKEETRLNDLAKRLSKEAVKTRVLEAAKPIKVMTPVTQIPGLETP